MISRNLEPSIVAFSQLSKNKDSIFRNYEMIPWGDVP